MHFLDTSAFLKLVVDEPHAAAMRHHLSDGRPALASALLRVESLRAIRRLAIDRLDFVEGALASVQLLPIDAGVISVAESLDPDVLRSLDAIHLATALSARDVVTTFVTYDRQLSAAAAQHGLTVVAPGLI